MRPWTYFTVHSVFHSLLAAFGIYRLARHFGASIAGAFVAGALWTASGPFVSLVDLWHHYAGTAWISWVFLTVVRALECPRRGGSPRPAWCWPSRSWPGRLTSAMTLLAIGSYAAVFRLDWRAPLALANPRLVGAGAAVLLSGWVSRRRSG